MARRIGYSLLSALLLSIPWWGGSALTLLIAFVPLLKLQQLVADTKVAQGERPLRLYPYILLTFALWWGSTTWWVGHAALIGAVLAVVFGAALNTAVFMLYHAVWKRATKALAYTLFVTGWLAYEQLYTHGEISFPWLTLGNGFAGDVKLIQWYEYTGVFGGSLWVLISNLLIFHALKDRKRISAWIASGVAILVPVAFSLGIYCSYEEPAESVSVSVIQPNFDPYTEKFQSGLLLQQHQTIVDMVRSSPSGVEFVVAPETALHESIWEDRMEETYMPRYLRKALVMSHPQATLICGAITRRKYNSEAEASSTATKERRAGFWYDSYNSALVIDTTQQIGISHKSMLVAGAEKVPYPKLFSGLAEMAVELGGPSGYFGMDSVRAVFETAQGVRHATAICYESIYSQYYTDFVRNGAQIMFVITNDGWWRNTTGYRNHFAYARLRAIENRRSVARSANTGISGLINQRGDVVDSLGWDQQGIVSGELHLNSNFTCYTLYGDLIGRISNYIFILSLLYFMAYRIRKKSHLVE